MVYHHDRGRIYVLQSMDFNVVVGRIDANKAKLGNMKYTISKINLLNLSSRNQTIFLIMNIPGRYHVQVMLMYCTARNRTPTFHFFPRTARHLFVVVTYIFDNLKETSFDNLKETIVTLRDALNHKKTSFFLVYTQCCLCW